MSFWKDPDRSTGKQTYFTGVPPGFVRVQYRESWNKEKWGEERRETGGTTHLAMSNSAKAVFLGEEKGE